MLKLSVFLLLFLAAAHSVSAHTYLFRLNVNGTDTGRGEYIRKYRESTINTPVKDVNNIDLRCRTDKMNAKDTKNITIVAGEKFGLEFHEGDEDTSRFIEEEHRGPVLIYMAPLESNGEGDVWFKVFEGGYDPKTKKFYDELLMKSGGKMEFTIPEEIKGGNYIMRPEVIALHTADKKFKPGSMSYGAEFFPNCVQIKLISKGTLEPKGYPIPGIYKADDPGIFFNLWDKYDSYVIPGPPMYNADAGTPVDQQGGPPAGEGGEPSVEEKPTVPTTPTNPDKPIVKPVVVKKPCQRKKKRRSYQ
ncbi:hypothetical protein H4S04_004210 [Coemansia sp. S16]|nr:hypothetical protein H4S04_004210 [Coemansia sp. S16]KAJ2069638.1 hypothetical protein GGI08_000246 [Coemansia sp. S2]KAJ2353142.1 hypothetical protein GGH92_000850 [Coemansia sp. RSA 2673]